MARRKKTEEQMKLFEEGGLKDEGGTVDPVSGNDVPVGSTQKEVRDDIPAQLSEGEFVFPADVTRYIGLENLMELRNKAKKGLAQMEAMGQMGNSEEATMDDTEEMDVDIDALIDEFDPNSPETMQFAMGGVVKAQAGALIPSGQMPPQQFSYGYMPTTPPPQQFQYPQYSQMVQQPAQGAVAGAPAVEDKQYIGPNGELITIRFMNGKPQQNIPQGFKVYKPEEVKPPEVVAPTIVQQDGGGDGPEEDNRTQLEKDMSRTEPKTRDVAQDLLDNLTDPEAKTKVQTQLDKLNKAVKAAYAAPFAAMVPGVGLGIAGKLARNAIKEDDAMDALIKEVSGLSTRQYRDELDRQVADKGLEDVVRDTMEREYGSGYLDRDELDALSRGTEQERINSFNDIVNAAGRSDLTIGGDDSPSPTRGQDITDQVRDSLSEQRGDSPDDADSRDSGTGGTSEGSFDASTTEDSGYSSSFSKGGAVQQTQRALKSSRKK